MLLLGACATAPATTSDTAPGTTTPGTSATDTPNGAPPTDDVTGDLVVFAAASLTDVFGALGEDFEQAHPGVEVTFSFAGSSTLAQQIVAGAPADVFAAASSATMAEVVDAGAAAHEPVVMARNTLQIAVPAGNPGAVTTLADLADENRTIALCAQQVPCGAAALVAFRAAGLTPAPDTLEQDVRAALTKVRLGEVDAALVYRTDVIAAGTDVEGIAFPEAAAAVNDYSLVTLADAPHARAADAFTAFVLSPAGRRVLTAAGFESP